MCPLLLLPKSWALGRRGFGRVLGRHWLSSSEPATHWLDSLSALIPGSPAPEVRMLFSSSNNDPLLAFISSGLVNGKEVDPTAWCAHWGWLELFRWESGSKCCSFLSSPQEPNVHNARRPGDWNLGNSRNVAIKQKKSPQILLSNYKSRKTKTQGGFRQQRLWKPRVQGNSGVT